MSQVDAQAATNHENTCNPSSPLFLSFPTPLLCIVLAREEKMRPSCKVLGLVKFASLIPNSTRPNASQRDNGVGLWA